MSDGDVVMRFVSQADADLFDAFTKAAKHAADAGSKFKETSAAADRVDASLKRFAANVKDLTATPIESLTRETEKLDRALKANLLTQEEHGRAVSLAQDRYAAKLQKIREEQEKANAPAETPVDASLMRFAERIKELNATPLETLTRETERLDAALKQNLLTAEQHGRAVAAAQEQYKKATAPAETPVDASLVRFADRVKELNATPLELLTRETERLDSALKQNLLTAEQHGRAVAAAQTRYQEELRKTREEQEKANAPPPVELTAADKAKQAALDAHQVRLRQIQQAYSVAAISAEQFSAAAAASTERLNADLAEAANETSEVDREMRRLAQSARELARTPVDRLNEKMVQLGALLAQNRIRQSEFSIAAKQAQDQYQKELDESIAKTKLLDQTSTQTASSATGALLNMKAGVIAGWAAVGSYVMNVLSRIRQDADDAGRSLTSQAGSRGTLAQLANGPEELRQLTDAAKRVRAAGGAESMDAANRFVFSMQSAGAISEIDTFAQLKNLGILEQPQEMIKFAAAVRKSFGADKTGSFRDVLNRALVAGGSSPEQAEQVLKGTARTGVSAANQGVSIDEAMAAVSLMSSATGSGEEAGTRVAAFLRGVSSYTPSSSGPINYSLRGKTLRQLLDDENLAKLSPGELQKVAGGAEGADFFGVARKNRSELLSVIDATKRARDADLLQQKIRAVQEDPAAMAAARLVAEQGRAEVGREQMGIDALRAQQAQLMLSEQIRRGDNSFFNRYVTPQLFAISGAGKALSLVMPDQRVESTMASIGMDTMRLAGGDSLLIRLVERISNTSEAGDRAARSQADAAQSLERAAQALERAAANGRTTTWSRAAQWDAGRDPE